MSSAISRRALAKIVAAKLLEEKADTAALMRSLAAYLVENKMTEHADAVMNDIADELLEQSGLLSVEIHSARTLDDGARTKLIEYLKSSTGASNVSLHESIDKTLIGGLIARTPSSELDASVRSKLRQLTAIS